MKNPIQPDPDYTNLIDLLAVFSEASRRLQEIGIAHQESVLESADQHRGDYAEAQSAANQASDAIMVLARKHPEWFPDKKRTVSTPYGTVKCVTGHRIETESEEASIRLIEAAGLGAAFLRTVKELDKDAIKRLTDEELAKFELKRTPTETITIKPTVSDLGDLAKSTDESEEAAA